MTGWRWLLVGLGAVLAIAGTTALVMYFALRTGGPVWQAYAAGGKQLATVEARDQRALATAVLDSVGKLLAASNTHATTAQHQDITVTLDTGLVARWVDSLVHATSAADSLRRYPPIVLGQAVAITDLTVARNNWRGAFNEQAQANASLIALHASDTLFRGRLLAHLDSLPKPPRTGIVAWLLSPHPYARGGWNSRTGTYLDGGLCLGSCGP